MKPRLIAAVQRASGRQFQRGLAWTLVGRFQDELRARGGQELITMTVSLPEAPHAGLQEFSSVSDAASLKFVSRRIFEFAR